MNVSHGPYTLSDPAIGESERRVQLRRIRFVPQPEDEFLPFHEQIQQRAYAIYVERGQEHGYDLDDWLAAEEGLEFELSTGLFIRAAA